MLDGRYSRIAEQVVFYAEEWSSTDGRIDERFLEAAQKAA